MPRRPDLFGLVTEKDRIKIIRELCCGVLGDEKGTETFARLEPTLRYKLRQPGDHPEPEHNHWKGVWRIYEAE